MTSFVCSLASGSLGNALLVASAKTRVLVDMGISRRRTKAALAEVDVALEDVQAVLLTHTHHDHFSASAATFCRLYKVPVYSTSDNIAHLAYELKGFSDLVAAGLARPIDGRPLTVGDITVEAFPVPHDSAGRCLGFRLSLGGPRSRRVVSVATDLGHVPAGSLGHFVNADAVVLESNHDPEMLRASNRPLDLIERILGPDGHLSNGDAAAALAEIVGRSRPGKVSGVVLSHLSRDCNRPHLALAAQAHLARNHSHPIRITAATQYEAGPVVGL
jgi:phosphoribosyl 1,2-cyclic phosphodiesterase